MNSPIGNGAGSVGTQDYPVPQREKYWEECSVEQKIERLRDMVMSLNRDHAEMSQALMDLLRHGHAEGGTIVTPIKHPGQNDALGYARDRSYSIKTERERDRTYW